MSQSRFHDRPLGPFAGVFAGVLTALLVCLSCGCGKSGRGSNERESSSETAAGGATGGGSIHLSDWVRARLDLARERSGRAPDEALAIAVAALRAEPASVAARGVVEGLLVGTRWHLPEVELVHPGGIDHMHLEDPAALWVAVGGKAPTIVRWDLEQLRVGSVWFPLEGGENRAMVVGPGGRRVVVERAGVVVLGDAMTLKPVREIGPLPQRLTPSAVVVFSPDGLLLAHPVAEGADAGRVVWHLRDAERGEVLRVSEPLAKEEPAPLAAWLDRSALRVFRVDGSVWQMPVSPAEPIAIVRPAGGHYLRARFSRTGETVLALRDGGPHQAPVCERIAWNGDAGSVTSTASATWSEAEPWTRLPSSWSDGLLPAAGLRLEVDADGMQPPSTGPYRIGSPVTAAVFRDDRQWIGCRDGRVVMHRMIPPPVMRGKASDSSAGLADPAVTEALSRFVRGFAGVDEVDGEMVRVSLAERRQAVAGCDLEVIGRWLPGLDFAPVEAALADWKPCELPADATAVMERRFAAFRERPSMADLEALHRDGSNESVIEAIRAAGGSGAAAAKHLELALASNQAARIAASLESAVKLPPLLHRLALSRIAWLDGRKADAIAGWPEGFPDLNQVRRVEDWEGWEQADFAPALAALRGLVDQELDRLKLPPNATAEQRRAVIAHLDDPETAKAVGRARFAVACLETALALAEFKEESTHTFRLATMARTMGGPPVPCLRAEALALTALGDFRKARDRWVMILSDYPVATHEPGDYAEAAYTAFENADPRQAMAILATGIHRYPEDASFALRAGWVALLTGNAEPAYRFLLAGMRIGYPPEKLENATALLSIAAALAGAPEDAEAFFRELVRLDPAWLDPATIDALAWPDELKAPLRDLAG
jgi:tetratricopeptide (TPR) repeat protein